MGQQLSEPNPRSGLRTAGDPLPNRKGTDCICNICKKEFPFESYDDGSYSGAKVDGGPVCYSCWANENTNREVFTVTYSLTSYVTNKRDVLKTKPILLKDLPRSLNKILRTPGKYLNFVLIRASSCDPDMGNNKSGSTEL